MDKCTQKEFLNFYIGITFAGFLCLFFFFISSESSVLSFPLIFYINVFFVVVVVFVFSELETVPSVLYEFPNGYSRQIGIDRFRISEGLFDTSHMTNMKVNFFFFQIH